MSALDVQVGGEHYKDSPIQPVQYIEANKLGFLEGCVVKRLTRHGKPTGKGRQDIEKAIHELQLLLELRYPATATHVVKRPLEVSTCSACGVKRGELHMPGCFAERHTLSSDRCLVCGGKNHGGLGCPSMQPMSDFVPNT